MTARPAPRRLAHGLGTLAAVLAAAVLAALTLTGCDLRFESAPPTAPAPGTAELVRERTVADALALAAAARSARSAADAATAAVLADVVTFSTAHAVQLGGAYRSGLATATPTAAPSTVVATPADVLGSLRVDAATALADADTAADGATARLLAAVGVSRAQLATRLAGALHEPPAPPTATAAPTGGAPTAPPAATPSPSATAGAALAAADVSPLVLAHDQAGFGLEVIAAKLTGAARQVAATSAAAHRRAAQAWAQRVGIAGTAADPRRAVYALPPLDAANAPALAASLEVGVADAAGAALLGAPPDVRGALVDELSSAETAAATWGAAPSPFPGIPGLG